MKISGIPVSSGIAMNNVYKITDYKIEVKSDLNTNIDQEIMKFHNALEISISELEYLKDNTSKELGLAELEVFSSHQLIVKDPIIRTKVEDLITNKQFNAGFAYKKVIDEFILTFENMENEYMSERAIDIIDVYYRVICKLTNKASINNLIMTKEVIIVASDITPSLVSSINPKLVKGIILKRGGKTSHSSIMIKNLGIPLILGVGNTVDQLFDGDFILMDGELGNIISSPTSSEISKYVNRQKELIKEEIELRKFIDKETVSKDGKKIKMLANINNNYEVDLALNNGAEGIGLYRTELMYLKAKSFPSEDELFETYKHVLNVFSEQPVIIRTIDIGGDKIPKYLKFKDQDTLRGLPLTLSNSIVFKAQIKALLRANTNNNLSIMFPMVGSLDKLVQAIDLVEKCKAELLNNDIPVSNNYKLGIMVEEIGIIKDLRSYASKVDFFSIGTNDLLESMYDGDRLSSNSELDNQYLSQEFLDVIKEIINISHDAGITTSMCGEMASDFEVIPLLLKYGIDSLSMSPKSILKTKYLISKINIK